jgi:hypothetical protein
LKIRHPEHIHCIHIHGWNTSAWCPECRHHWLNTSAIRESKAYEQQADADLARAVILAMENGEIPAACIMAEIEIPNIMALAEPSAN